MMYPMIEAQERISEPDQMANGQGEFKGSVSLPIIYSTPLGETALPLLMSEERG